MIRQSFFLSDYAASCADFLVWQRRRPRRQYWRRQRGDKGGVEVHGGGGGDDGGSAFDDEAAQTKLPTTTTTTNRPRSCGASRAAEAPDPQPPASVLSHCRCCSRVVAMADCAEAISPPSSASFSSLSIWWNTAAKNIHTEKNAWAEMFAKHSGGQ